MHQSRQELLTLLVKSRRNLLRSQEIYRQLQSLMVCVERLLKDKQNHKRPASRSSSYKALSADGRTSSDPSLQEAHLLSVRSRDGHAQVVRARTGGPKEEPMTLGPITQRRSD